MEEKQKQLWERGGLQLSFPSPLEAAPEGGGEERAGERKRSFLATSTEKETLVGIQREWECRLFLHAHPSRSIPWGMIRCV